MKQFLEQLFTTGEVSVLPPGTAFDILEDVDPEILRFDRAARLALASQAPELDLEVAAWAASLLAESARLAIAREMGPKQIEEIFTRECPRRRSPEVDYSADLFLRYVPDLLKWVQRLASDDPLVARLRQVAADWPLSSVGIKELMVVGDLAPFIEHPGLRQLYVDRILSTGDIGRLKDERVARAVRAALGAYPDLSPVVSRELEKVAGSSH